MEHIARVLRRSNERQGKKGEGFVRLFISKRLIHGAASALLGIFIPIYIYSSTGELFWPVGLYYASVYFFYAVLLVPSMKITNFIGFSRALVLAGIFSVIQMSAWYFIQPENLINWLWLILIFAVCFRLFHWVPYHVDFTLFTRSGERGKQLSLTYATIAFMGVLGPLAAGFIIDKSSYDVLFGLSIALFVASTISYAFVPETSTRFTWSYKKTLSKLFGKELRGMNLGAFANGAETAVTLIVWPVFLYEVFNGDFLDIGLISTVIVALTIVVQFLVGKHIDKRKGNSVKTLKVGSTLYAIGWILKIFALSVTQVFFVGLYHSVTKIFTQTPFAAILYDMSGDQGRYVDEYTVVREMADNFGRVISLLAVILVASFVPINYTFILAALASIALNMVYQISRD